MFNKKTLLVVGAGASKEVDIPTGSELKQSIADRLDLRFAMSNEQKSGDPTIYEALAEAIRRESQRGSITPYILAGQRIHAAMPLAPSIDAFIDAHHGDKHLELCGKLAIVRAILRAERKSLLFIDTSQGQT